jgi:hypothetical protein
MPPAKYCWGIIAPEPEAPLLIEKHGTWYAAGIAAAGLGVANGLAVVLEEALTHL